MSPDVVIYTTPFCVYCVRAKMFFARKGVSFREVDVSRDEGAREQMRAATGTRRVPQIFVNGRHLGGFYELASMDRNGELEAFLTMPAKREEPDLGG